MQFFRLVLCKNRRKKFAQLINNMGALSLNNCQQALSPNLTALDHCRPSHSFKIKIRSPVWVKRQRTIYLSTRRRGRIENESPSKFYDQYRRRTLDYEQVITQDYQEDIRDPSIVEAAVRGCARVCVCVCTQSIPLSRIATVKWVYNTRSKGERLPWDWLFASKQQHNSSNLLLFLFFLIRKHTHTEKLVKERKKKTFGKTLWYKRGSLGRAAAAGHCGTAANGIECRNDIFEIRRYPPFPIFLAHRTTPHMHTLALHRNAEMFTTAGVGEFWGGGLELILVPPVGFWEPFRILLCCAVS